MNKLLTSILFLLLSGCAATSIKQPLKIYYQPFEKVGIIQLTTKHDGSFSEAMGGFSPVLSAIASGAEEESGSTKYAKELNINMLNAVESALIIHPDISFSKAFDDSALTKKNITSSDIKNYSTDNNLDYLLSLNIHYTSGSGLAKPLSLIVTWNIFNNLGEKVGVVETTEVTKETFDHFPNSMDIRYKKPYLSLAEPITKRFMSFFINDNTAVK